MFFVCPSLHHPHRPKVGAFTQIPRQPPRVPFCLPMPSPTPTDKKSGSPPGSVQSPRYLSARPLTDSHRPEVWVSTRIRSTPMVPFCPPPHLLPQTKSPGLHPDPFNPHGTFLPAPSPTPTDQKSGSPPGSLQPPWYLSARPLTYSHRPKVRVSTRIPSTLGVPFCPPTHPPLRPKVWASTRISSTQRVPFLRLSTAESNYAVLDRRKRYIFKGTKTKSEQKARHDKAEQQ